MGGFLQTQPIKPVEQLYHVIRQVLVEIEQQLGGLLVEMKRQSAIEAMIPLAKLVSEIRKVLCFLRSFNQIVFNSIHIM